MAKKVVLEGVEYANDFMLKQLYKFLLVKKFYGKEEDAEMEEKARKDVLLKNGKLRKLLEKEGIVTRYDLALNHTDSCFDNFGPYAKIMKQFRKQVIKESFQHRKDECK